MADDNLPTAADVVQLLREYALGLVGDIEYTTARMNTLSAAADVIESRNLNGSEALAFLKNSQDHDLEYITDAWSPDSIAAPRKRRPKKTGATAPPA